jgi:AraC-like DNA-binding protein
MIQMGKNLAFMVKTNIPALVALKNKKYRCFLNNTPAAPVACNIISVTDLNKNVENHSLPYFSFLCVLQGHGKILLNKKANDLKPGTAVLRFTDEKFSIYRTKDYVEFSIALPSEFGALIRKYYTENVNIIEFKLSRQLLTSFKDIFDFTRSNDNLLNSAFKMVKFIIEICSTKEYEKYLPNDNFTERACALLNKSLNSISPGIDTAQKMGMGYENFRKKFKQLTGVSPKQYIIRLKLAKAAEMILNDYSIKETAFELSYSDIAAFSRQFKKFHGISPAKYRKEAKFLYES